MTSAAKALKKWIADNSSQGKLATTLNVSQPSVFAWLRGTSRPKQNLREEIQRLTGIAADEWELRAERTKREKAQRGVDEALRESKGAA